MLQPRDEMNGTQENLSGGNQMREQFVGSHLAQPQVTLSIRASGYPVLPISFILVLPRKLAVPSTSTNAIEVAERNSCYLALPLHIGEEAAIALAVVAMEVRSQLAGPGADS